MSISFPEGAVYGENPLITTCFQVEDNMNTCVCMNQNTSVAEHIEMRNVIEDFNHVPWYDDQFRQIPDVLL